MKRRFRFDFKLAASDFRRRPILDGVLFWTTSDIGCRLIFDEVRFWAASDFYFYFYFYLAVLHFDYQLSMYQLQHVMRIYVITTLFLSALFFFSNPTHSFFCCCSCLGDGHQADAVLQAVFLKIKKSLPGPSEC